jgi:hypothetical protein
MCLVIDANTIPRVFDPQNSEHSEFRPVLEWIITGKGKVVYGGTTYYEEVGGKHLQRFMGILIELGKRGKTVVLKTSVVDQEQLVVASIIPDKEFDDKHIAAIIRVSGCKVFCSRDKRAIPYLKSSKLFKAKDKPRFYTSSKNSNLLTEKYLSDCCAPHKPLAKSVSKQLLRLLDG